MNLVSSLISFAAQYLTEILSRPFQRIYTIQQTKKILNGIQKNFKSKSEITKVFDTISEIKNKEGYIGFWKCLLYTSTKNWIYFPLKSSFEDIFKPLRNAFDPNEQYEYFVMNKAALDALATACATAFTHPIDCAILKSSSIVGNVANTPQEEILINKGIFKYIKHVVHTQRISSLYIGFGFRIGTSFYENIICKIFDILFWNYLFSNVEHSKKSSSILHQICLCCTWLFTYPVHLVTSKIMVQMGDDPNTQKNPLEIIKSIWENQGILGFYEGGLVNLLLCLILNSFNNKRIPEDIQVIQKEDHNNFYEYTLRNLLNRFLIYYWLSNKKLISKTQKVIFLAYIFKLIYMRQLLRLIHEYQNIINYRIINVIAEYYQYKQ